MEYHKIETVFERDGKFKVMPDKLRNPVYGIIRQWEWTEKIDGTNIRLIWQHADKALTFGGKTDNAQIPSKLMAWLMGEDLRERMLDVFPDTDAVVYGEGYGAGIQKGGGDYSPQQKFIAFDVLVDGRWWLNQENVDDVAAKLGLDVVPKAGSMTLDSAVKIVSAGFPSALGVAKAEGLVGRTVEPLFDKKGHRLIVKLKTKDF